MANSSAISAASTSHEAHSPPSASPPPLGSERGDAEQWGVRGDELGVCDSAPLQPVLQRKFVRHLIADGEREVGVRLNEVQ